MIFLPAGFLGNFIFETGRPYYSNFGIVGLIIAHEIIHGFDSNGRLYDLDGNLVNWWDFETEKEFHSKTEELI